MSFAEDTKDLTDHILFRQYHVQLGNERVNFSGNGKCVLVKDTKNLSDRVHVCSILITPGSIRQLEMNHSRNGKCVW